jgi:hypothetical protein
MPADLPASPTLSPSVEVRRALAMERYIHHGGDVSDVLEMIFAGLPLDVLARVELMLSAPDESRLAG